MYTACWSVKGGSGTTVVVASLALAAARNGARVVVADLAGDLPAVLGVGDPPGPGLADWLDAGPDVPDEALARLAAPVNDAIRLVARGAPDGSGSWDDAAAGVRLAAALRAFAGEDELIIDAGRGDRGALASLVASADRSLLVLRPCYVALRRALVAPRPTAVALIVEPDRALGATDVEDVLGVPVVAEVAWDPAVARAVDAGLMATRLPRRLAAALRGLAA